MGDTPGKINMSPKKRTFFRKEMHLPWFFQGIPVKFPNCTCIDYPQKCTEKPKPCHWKLWCHWVKLGSIVDLQHIFIYHEQIHVQHWRNISSRYLYVQISSKHIPSSTSNLGALTPFVIIISYASSIHCESPKNPPSNLPLRFCSQVARAIASGHGMFASSYNCLVNWPSGKLNSNGKSTIC